MKIELARFFLQIQNRRPVRITVRTGLFGVGNSLETLAAPAFYFDLLFEAKELFNHFAIQLEGPGPVSPENIRNRTIVAQIGIPGQGVGIPFNQTAGLHVAATMKVAIIIFTLFTSRCFHNIVSY
jgi:hypothetical protein